MKIFIILVLIILALRALSKNIYFSFYSDLKKKMNEDRMRPDKMQREGQVTIDKSIASRRGKNNNSDDGEFVDYTEVK